MISCLLIQVTRNQHGLQIRKEVVIEGKKLQIGRGPTCKIHLPDHRVNLLHATIKRYDDESLHIEGEEDLIVNGHIQKCAPLLPNTQIEIGPYRCIVTHSNTGHEIALSVEMIHQLFENSSDEPLSLAALNWSKRKTGFRLAAIIFFLFLLLPLLPNVSSFFNKAQTSLPIALNESWNPGPMSSGHSRFGTQCTTCHQYAFKSVPDSVCQDCHKQIKHHLATDILHAGIFKNRRCTQCHQDHQGENGLINHESSQCVDCHSKIKSIKSDSKIDNIDNFSTNHPQFHPVFKNGNKIIHLNQDENNKPIEKSGLKYSHQVHLAKDGISSPQGDTVMLCQDCHKLEDSGMHFEPMTMKKTCQQSGCHALDFTEPVEGSVPHGAESAVMNKLRGFYSQWLLLSPDNMTECKLTANDRNIKSCVDELAQKNAANTLFRPNDECGECHEIESTSDNDAPWKVNQVNIQRDWMPSAVFPHSKHNTMKCTECHDKLNSKSSSDISMPTIVKCRECHSGNQAEKGKIRTNCDSCHHFHQHTNVQG